MAPSQPTASIALRSSGERIPPAARTRRPDSAHTSARRSNDGPPSVPSRSIAVHRSRLAPACVARSTASGTENDVRRVQPSTATVPARTSIATTSLSPSSRDELVEKAAGGERRGTDDDALGACGHERRGVPRRAHASCSLDARRRRCRDRASDELRPHAACPGCAQVDDVDDLRTGRGDALDQRERVSFAERDLVVVATEESNRFRAEDVDGRDDLECLWLAGHRVSMLTCCNRRWPTNPRIHGERARQTTSSRRFSASGRWTRRSGSSAISARSRRSRR